VSLSPAYVNFTSNNCNDQQRLDDLEHNHLVHAAKPISPTKALLRNLWVLLLCAGVLIIVLLGKSRLHVPEPLEHVHAVNSAEPYFVPLGTAHM
jgi:hypothetical protein